MQNILQQKNNEQRKSKRILYSSSSNYRIRNNGDSFEDDQYQQQENQKQDNLNQFENIQQDKQKILQINGSRSRLEQQALQTLIEMNTSGSLENSQQDYRQSSTQRFQNKVIKQTIKKNQSKENDLYDENRDFNRLISQRSKNHINFNQNQIILKKLRNSIFKEAYNVSKINYQDDNLIQVNAKGSKLQQNQNYVNLMIKKRSTSSYGNRKIHFSEFANQEKLEKEQIQKFKLKNKQFLDNMFRMDSNSIPINNSCSQTNFQPIELENKEILNSRVPKRLINGVAYFQTNNNHNYNKNHQFNLPSNHNSTVNIHVPIQKQRQINQNQQNFKLNKKNSSLNRSQNNLQTHQTEFNLHESTNSQRNLSQQQIKIKQSLNNNVKSYTISSKDSLNKILGIPQKNSSNNNIYENNNLNQHKDHKIQILLKQRIDKIIRGE